jgi:malonyl-CoA decarboxylase
MAETTNREPRLFSRTLANLAGAWREVSAGAARTVERITPDSGRQDVDGLRRLMQACVEARGGEVSARGRAAELGRQYLAMSSEQRLTFFILLAREFGCRQDLVADAIAAYHAAADGAERAKAETRLRRALEPPRVTILRQFHAIPDGTKFLVDMRAELLRHVADQPELQRLDDDLRDLLIAWFDVGFLDFQQITWRSSAALLEKLIAYEAVHEIRDWNDLRDRLDSDRRCYALFHPRMPEEPLAFIEVALTRKMAASVQRLLDDETPPDDPGQARAAIFYSISNTQQGLRGISFGDHLIKQVVTRLHQELPRLETFATLSPIPGFRDWLETASPRLVRALTDDDERRALADLADQNDPATALRTLVQRLGEHPHDEALAGVLKDPLMRLCGRYLLARRGDGMPRDPVARFHLKNGARLERVNWLGDVSAKGMRQSAGMMVNYRYVLDEIEANHEAYMRDRRIALGSEMQSLLRSWKDWDGTPLRNLSTT